MSRFEEESSLCDHSPSPESAFKRRFKTPLVGLRRVRGAVSTRSMLRRFACFGRFLSSVLDRAAPGQKSADTKRLVGPNPAQLSVGQPSARRHRFFKQLRRYTSEQFCSSRIQFALVNRSPQADVPKVSGAILYLNVSPCVHHERGPLPIFEFHEGRNVPLVYLRPLDP